MYHAVTAQENDAAGYVHISLQAFADQMKWLADNDYTAISVAEMTQQRNTPSKKVVLTFDDGYYSLYHLVTPVLRQYGFSATLFLTTYPIGAATYAVLPHLEKSYPPDDRPLTWEELKEMEYSCWDIQAHGHKHLAHNMLLEESLQPEISKSKSLIEYHLGKKVQYYAFPYGRYNALCLTLCSQLGMKAVFTVHPGLANNNGKEFRLPRVEINRNTTIMEFRNKMLTGFSNRRQRMEWLFLQLLYKNVWLKDRMKRTYDQLIKK